MVYILKISVTRRGSVVFETLVKKLRFIYGTRMCRYRAHKSPPFDPNLNDKKRVDAK